jgi:hypothetical protein
LQVPQLEVGFYRGTNEVGQLQFGRVLTNDATSVYARLPIYSNVVTTSRAFAELLNQPYKAFHDPRLIDFPLSAVQRVVVDGTETFLLEQTHSNTWLVVHTNQYAADSALVTRFLTNVAGLQILDIAREVASVEDLSTFGFSPARLSFRFYSHQGNSGAVATNALLAQIEFGSNLVDTIYMRRTDEVPIYLGQLADVLTLPRRAYEFRDRQLWTAQEPHVLAISISSEGKRVDLRRQENSQWHSDPITGAAIQELVHRVVTVKAQHWINKGDQRLSSYGLSNPSLTLVLALNSPTLPRIELHFGRFTVRRDVYAATILPGEHEPVVFEFPGFLYHELRNFFFPQN